MSDKTIIEVNGVKMEVDLRNAKVIDHLRVGDAIKVLTKNYSSYESNPGVVVGFDNFKTLPTIIIAYMKLNYGSSDLLYVYYNSESKDVEIVPANEHDISFSKSDVLGCFDREIQKKENEIKEINQKKEYFLHHFNRYFAGN